MEGAAVGDAPKDMSAPEEHGRRLAWFAGATLVAAALAVRAYMTS